MLKTSIFSLAMLMMVAPGTNAEPQSEQSSVSTIESFSILPAIRSVQTSPDGKHLAVLKATSKNGDYVLEVRKTADMAAEPVRLGADKMRISSVSWLNNEKIGVMFRQLLEDSGSKYWVTQFAITNANGKGEWLIPFRESRQGFSIIDLLHDDNKHILVEGDVNDNYIPDVVKLDIYSGRTKTLVRGSDKVNGSFIADKDGDVRVGQGFNRADQAIDVFARKKGDDEWIKIHSVSGEKRETFDIAGVSAEQPNKLYVIANQGENTTGVYLYDIVEKTYSERLFGLKSVDVDAVLQDKEDNLIGFSYTAKHPEFYFTNPEYQAVQDGVKQLYPDKFVRVVSRSEDDNTLVVMTQSDDDPGTYYVILNKKDIVKLGEKMPFIDKNKLGETKYISYKARDGRKIRAYLTIPQGKGPFPAVVLPHGGPWVRDTVIFDDWAQLLASHGYVVIQPNYRGSTGYGLEHWKAGDKNWGLKMQDDLDDAALYLVDKGLATKDKLAMFGWSYGGYAAFAASMRDKNIYQCTVAGAGVSDLNRINATLNDNPLLSKLQKPTIAGVSPVEQVEKVNVPILVIHGDIDGRVPIEHSDAFVNELKQHNKNFKYVVLEDADHFSDTLFFDHKMTFYSELVDWLDNRCGLK
ncbi:alpha/beta hydrolase family protein [Pseudoalteromonas ruthenica]|uniref:alpha/beta hydrolase family protein n=1 Tax=Pseudoalteromonas ruthenica TaxID=151081 RepID=UPI0003B2F1EB|nr:prolyl oligopeptidase family serine peptidase [Pseudoalteromonas ruthenica]